VLRGGVRPDELVEAAVLAQGEDGGGVADGRIDLEPVADDPGVSHEAGPVVVAEPRHRLGVETREGGTEPLALAQDGDPREPGLEGLEGQPFVERLLAVDRPAPLAVVVVEVVRRRPGPGAPGKTVLAHGQTAHRPLPPAVARACSSARASMPSRARP
jgi:hypothetical protein